MYVVNNCDPLFQGSGYNYSPLLLRLTVFKSQMQWINVAGPTVITLFFLSLATLPPPGNLLDQAIQLLATLSSSIWLGIERANIDLILFLLIIVALNLRVLALPFRLVGYAVLTLAGLLKFYPFVALVVVLRERISVFIAVTLASVAALAALISAYHPELSLMASKLPEVSYFNLQFGSANLPVVLGVTTANALRFLTHDDPPAARAIGTMVTRAALPLLTILALVAALAIGRRCRLAQVLARFGDRETGYLVAGAALICGCFFMVNSHVFRGMFLLLALPGLAALSRQVPPGGRLFATVCYLTPFVLWKPFFDMCLIVASHWQSPPRQPQ